MIYILVDDLPYVFGRWCSPYCLATGHKNWEMQEMRFFCPRADSHILNGDSLKCLRSPHPLGLVLGLWPKPCQSLPPGDGCDEPSFVRHVGGGRDLMRRPTRQPSAYPHHCHRCFSGTHWSSLHCRCNGRVRTGGAACLARRIGQVVAWRESSWHMQNERCSVLCWSTFIVVLFWNVTAWGPLLLARPQLTRVPTPR